MIKFNGEDWKILLVSSNHPMLHLPSGGYTIGACDDNLKTIYICENLPPQKTKKVLCHEITHAAMFSYNTFLDEAQEELLADLIATYGQEIICITNKIFHRLRR